MLYKQAISIQIELALFVIPPTPTQPTPPPIHLPTWESNDAVDLGNLGCNLIWTLIKDSYNKKIWVRDNIFLYFKE